MRIYVDVQAPVNVSVSIGRSGCQTSGARVVGGSEPPDVGAGNRAQGLWKSSVHSKHKPVSPALHDNLFL